MCNAVWVGVDRSVCYDLCNVECYYFKFKDAISLLGAYMWNIKNISIITKNGLCIRYKRGHQRQRSASKRSIQFTFCLFKIVIETDDDGANEDNICRF